MLNFLKLLDYEPRAADQVPLLISMQQEELALNKAIESGDTDLGSLVFSDESYPLVYLVVLHLKRSRPAKDFFRIIHTKPVALNLLISYCKQQDLKLLKDLYFQFDQLQETANITVLEAFQHQVAYSELIWPYQNLDQRIRGLQDALTLYSESKDTFAAKVHQI